MMREAIRKDIKHAFGVLTSRYAIIEQPARQWTTEALTTTIKSCIILHNMTIEGECGQAVEYIYDDEATRKEKERRDISRKRLRADTDSSNDFQSASTLTMDDSSMMDNDSVFENYMNRYEQIRDTQKHRRLRNDLTQHLWKIHGRT